MKMCAKLLVIRIKPRVENFKIFGWTSVSKQFWATDEIFVSGKLSANEYKNEVAIISFLYKKFKKFLISWLKISKTFSKENFLKVYRWLIVQWTLRTDRKHYKTLENIKKKFGWKRKYEHSQMEFLRKMFFFEIFWWFSVSKELQPITSSLDKFFDPNSQELQESHFGRHLQVSNHPLADWNFSTFAKKIEFLGFLADFYLRSDA